MQGGCGQQHGRDSCLWRGSVVGDRCEKLVDLVNQTGEVFLSHTRLRGRIAIRIANGHLRTTEQHVRRAWDLLQQHAAALV